jgi:hypothetical protein
MKAAIIASDLDGFIKPFANGLQVMFDKIGVESDIFYKGLWWLTNPHRTSKSGKLGPADNVKKLVKSTYCKVVLANQLKKYDIVIIVKNMPASFLHKFFQNLEPLRTQINIPIINYDLHYLGSRGPWIKWILQGNPDHNILPGSGYGLERYDYYLMASVANEFPMPRVPHPCSIVGMHINDGSLYPDKNDKFIALVDFERKKFLPERQVQIDALEATDTEYIILDRHYTIDEIRSIYRRTAIYFVAHRESFGFPICETQACGNYIFTPYKHWVGSHYIKDVYLPWEENLSSNFIVYDNDRELLINEINRIKQTYNPQDVVSNFQENYPQLWEGDVSELKKFIDKVKNGEIHHELHLEHKALNDTIITSLKE